MSPFRSEVESSDLSQIQMTRDRWDAAWSVSRIAVLSVSQTEFTRSAPPAVMVLSALYCVVASSRPVYFAYNLQ